MTTLLLTLSLEVDLLSVSGETSLHGLLDSTHSFLKELRDLELALQEPEEELQEPQEQKAPKKVTLDTDNWYKESIGSLKSYNGLINKFLKNILNNPKYNIDLNEAYTYPLNLDGIPVQNNPDPRQLRLAGPEDMAMSEIKQENQEELTKAIILHLLKIGQRDIVKDMLADMGPESDIIVDEEVLELFKMLDDIVLDVTVNHNLTKALDWFKNNSQESLTFKEIEFKFHILQFALLLNGGNSHSNINAAMETYLYSKKNFPKFFKDYLQEISPLMTLLVVSGPPDSGFHSKLIDEFTNKVKVSFTKDLEKSAKRSSVSLFVREILVNFTLVNSFQHLFQNLANEFISFYCKGLNLSDDSSLFQSILAGFTNIPSFYKYNQIQRRLSRVHSITGESEFRNRTNSIVADVANNDIDPNSKNSEFHVIAPYTYDLPFQLPDANNFLFKYHPIFICPVSKEQLIPLTVSESPVDIENRAKRPKLEHNKDSELVKTMQNPVVVLRYCQHVALRESIWQLSMKGSEVFKCHYCYKKHKLSEVSEAYFIDL